MSGLFTSDNRLKWSLEYHPESGSNTPLTCRTVCEGPRAEASYPANANSRPATTGHALGGQ